MQYARPSRVNRRRCHGCEGRRPLGQTLMDRVMTTRWWQSGGSVLLTWDEAFDASGQALTGGIGSPPTGGGPVILLVMSAALTKSQPYQFGFGGDGNWDQPITHAGASVPEHTTTRREPSQEADWRLAPRRLLLRDGYSGDGYRLRTAVQTCSVACVPPPCPIDRHPTGPRRARTGRSHRRSPCV